MISKANLIYKLERLDWDFPGVRCASAFGSAHWHPCRYVSQIPAALIGMLSATGDLVLDPFSGSGTTVVEAQRLGRKGVAIDINPISDLITRSKTVSLDNNDIKLHIEKVKTDLFEYSSKIGFSNRDIISKVPASVQKDKWFSEPTIYSLAVIWSFLNRCESTIKPILEAAFSSILLASCNETRHWGYVCDNTKPKGEKIVDALGLYIDALKKFVDAYNERNSILSKGVVYPLEEVVSLQGDCISVLKEIDAESVDLIVTSPPYFGMCDYIKSQRLSFEWFQIEIEGYRKQEMGARSKRHRKAANQEYLSSLKGFLESSYRVLKKDSYMCLVIGESASRKAIIESFEQIVVDTGFDLIFDTERSVPVQRRQYPSLNDERVYVVRK
jgi:hypothetical protein